MKSLRLVLAALTLAALSALAQEATLTQGGLPATTPPEHVRGVEQTFLTYPEWFLVFSPAEYATSVRTTPPDRFPFFGHVGSSGRATRPSRWRAAPWVTNSTPATT